MPAPDVRSSALLSPARPRRPSRFDPVFARQLPSIPQPTFSQANQTDPEKVWHFLPILCHLLALPPGSVTPAEAKEMTVRPRLVVAAVGFPDPVTATEFHPASVDLSFAARSSPVTVCSVFVFSRFVIFYSLILAVAAYPFSFFCFFFVCSSFVYLA